MADREASVKFKADSTEFNSAIKSASAQVREMQSALKLNAEQMKAMGTSADSLTQREKLLAQEAEALASKKAALADKLKLAEECFGADSTQASSLRTQLSGLETQSVKVAAEMADVNAQLQAQWEAEARAETATEQLSGTISNQEKELEELKKQYVEAVLQYGDTSDEAKALAAQITDLSGELKENKSTMAAAEDAADALDQTMGDAGDAVEDAGDAAEESSEGWTTFKGVVADLASSVIKEAVSALQDLAQAAYDAAVEVDEGYDTIIKKTGATGDALEDLYDVADSVFTSLPVEMSDVGTAVGEVNTRFQATGYEFEFLTTQFLVFAVINDTDVNISIDTVDKIMTQWGLDIDDTSSLLGLLTSKGQETGISMDSLMSSVSENGSTFKALGLNLEESVELLAQMEANGVDTSTALSGLKKAVTNLTDAGMSEEEALNSVIDSIKNAETETEALSIAQETFGTKGAAEMATAIREGRLDLDDLSVSMDDYADTVEDTYNATLSPWDEMTVATNNLKVAGADLVTGILEDLAPAFEDMVDFMTGTAIPAVGNLADNFDAIAPIITAAAAAFVAYKTAMGISSVIETVTKATQGMSVAQAALNAVMNANPIAIVVALLAGLVTAIVTLWNTNEDFRNAVTEIWEGFKSTVSGVVDAVVGFFSNLGESAGNLVSSIADGWNDLTGKASSIWDGITGILSNAWGSIQSTVSDTASDVAAGVSEKWQSIKSTTSTVWNGIKSSVSTAVSNVATSVSTKWNAIKSTTSTVFSGVKSAASTAWNGIKSVISTGVSGALSTVTSKFNAIKSSISSVMDSAKSIVSNAISKIKSFFNFTWSLPILKMRHITIQVKIRLSPLSVPSFSLSWYKEGGVLNAATIFGASGNSLLGGGEAGPEAVAPIDVLQSYVAAAVDRSLSDYLSQVAQAIEALAERPIYLNVNGKTFAAATAGDFDTALGSRQALSARGLCL